MTNTLVTEGEAVLRQEIEGLKQRVANLENRFLPFTGYSANSGYSSNPTSSTTSTFSTVNPF